MNDDEALVETYFNWLRDDSFASRVNRSRFEGLLRALHDIPFYWTLWSDENRSGDALAFRQFDFLGQQENLDELDQHWLQRWSVASPSTFEVLMGIARRWSIHFGGEVQYYFHHMWKNMGFDEHPGKHLTSVSLDAIRLKVDIWMSRQFQPNGQGSPFPINDQRVFDIVDLRQIDIWGQMNMYSAEHFQ